ncbi:CFEM domain-containing protein [Pleurostoma richardsiae]|uniref:CFEM domain-containing protein n=1 Tax=Pleurostoma richardsiae TaxID=41990 RepID=A0AA38R6E3_9PEZI|nr:CFEM domain-containing protein [Pleurostoma richardsiae]
MPRRSRRPGLLAPLAIEVPACVAVLLRLSSKQFTSLSWDLDDWIMSVVAALFFVFLAIGQYAGMLCFGVDIWTVNLDTLTQGLKLFYVAESFYLAILILTKIAILFFYLRIFPNRRFRKITYAVMVWVGLSGLILLSMQIFQCNPVAGAWESWQGFAAGAAVPRCLDINALAYTAAAFSIAQDIVILLLPVPLLLGINASWRVRCGVLLMFSLGIFVLVTSCVRLRSLVRIARSTNPSWDYTDSLIWSGLEVAVSIIVNSLPAIRVLFARLMPTVFGSKIGRSARGPSPLPTFGPRTVAVLPLKVKSPDGSSGNSGNRAGRQPPLLRQQSSTGQVFATAARSQTKPEGDILELNDRRNRNVQAQGGASSSGENRNAISTAAILEDASRNDSRCSPEPNNHPRILVSTMATTVVGGSSTGK